MMVNTAQRVPVGGVLTPRMERMIRLGSIGSAVVIAVSAMVLSYAGLLDLALDAQIHPRLALLVPIMVDGLQFVGSLGVVYSTLSGLRSWYPWLLMLMGVSVSAWGNWQAAPDQMTAKLLHAAAPVILALVLEELLRVMRHKVTLHAEREQAEAEAAAQAVEQTTEQAEEQAAEQAGVAAVTKTVVEPLAPAPEPFSAADEPVTASAPTVVPAAGSEEAVVSDSVRGDALVEHVTAPEPSRTATEASVAPAPAPAVTESMSEPVAPETATSTAVEEPVAEPVPTKPAVVEPVPAPRTTAPAQAAATATEPDEEALPPYPEDGTFKDQIRAILLADPDIPAAKIARLMKKDGSHTRKTVRIVRAELDEEAAIESATSALVSPVVDSAPRGSATSPAQPSVVQPPVPDRSTADLTGADPFAVAAPVGAGR